MRPNRWVLLVSLLVGLFGSWSYVTAMLDYRRTTEAFTSIDVEYVDGSFAWLDEERRTAEALFVLENGSRVDATVEYLILRLYLDGVFAGAQYQPWEPISLDAGDKTEVTIPFEVSISTISAEATMNSTASVRGEMRLAFDQVERSLTVPLREQLSTEATGGG